MSFQETIASVVVPLSQRPPTAVHLPEKDPKFPDWDGDRTHLLLWLHQVDQIRQTKEIPDTVAVRFARHAMGVAAYGHFKEVPPSLAAFVKVLDDRFMPSDIPVHNRSFLLSGCTGARPVPHSPPPSQTWEARRPLCVHNDSSQFDCIVRLSPSRL